MTERLLIMRHGQAGSGTPDASRTLTAQGQEEVAFMAAWLVGRDDLDHSRLRLLASPYRRAQQTAELVAKAMHCDFETLPIITPDDSPLAVVDWLLEQREGTTLLLVSHMPLVGALTGLLVEGRPDVGPGFSTAAIAELEAKVLASGCARMKRLTSPADLA
jgi:phosphohistidine phosphatase SixA